MIAQQIYETVTGGFWHLLPDQKRQRYVDAAYDLTEKIEKLEGETWEQAAEIRELNIEIEGLEEKLEEQIEINQIAAGMLDEG